MISNEELSLQANEAREDIKRIIDSDLSHAIKVERLLGMISMGIVTLLLAFSEKSSEK